jgi:hypothetical protein
MAKGAMQALLLPLNHPRLTSSQTSTHGDVVLKARLIYAIKFIKNEKD